MADVQELLVNLKFTETGSLAATKANLAGAEAGARQLGSSISGAVISVQNLAKAYIGLNLLSEGTSFLKDSVTAAIEQEASTARLTQALKENIPAWNGATDAIERAVKVAQSKGFQDQEAEQSLAHLSAATHDIAEANRDLAVAEDLARFRNISLAEASDKLIRVIGGSSRVAKELGIDFAKTSTEAERLGLIEGVVAGQSDAFADKTAGKMAKASESIHQLQEDIGKGLLPVIGDLADALDKLLGKQGTDLATKTADFVKTATIEQIKAAREGVASQLARNRLLLGALGSGDIDEINGILRQLDEAISNVGQGMDESARSALTYAQDQSAATKAASDAALAADTSTAAQRRLAEATLAVAQAQQDVTDATKAASDAGWHDAATLAALATANNDLKTAQNQLVTAQGLVAASATVAATAEDRFTIALWNTVAAVNALANSPIPIALGGGKTPQEAASDARHAAANAETAREQYIAKLAADAKAEADRKAAQAISDAKAAASAYAATLRDKLNVELAKAKDLTLTLFDKQHERILRAISDTEKLAEKQHDASTQAISDELKLRLQRDAAPVTAAEKAQSDIEISRQNRDLHAALAAATLTGDPEQIRQAQESLQSFQASQRIAYLKEQQAIHDLAAQKEATDKQKAADDLLNAAKIAQANAIKAETDRNKKQIDDFERDLAALKKRDEGASPSKVKSDIAALERRFGITTDAQGHHHIEDPLVTAIKNVKIPVPRLEFHATIYSPAIFLNGRQIAAAMASNQSPAATPGVRTGILTPARG